MADTSNRAEPTILVVFGATGDLASRKIFPALYHLFRHGRLPSRVAIVGFSRGELSDEAFRARVRESLSRKHGVDEGIEAFLELFFYHRGMFDEAPAFGSLAERIGKLEGAWGQCGSKLFYIAVPPEWYPEIFKNLAASKLNVPCGGELGWSRILIEKPFGSDRKSAGELEELLRMYFSEEQTYRIDHYLFKEIVQGIEHFRFSNNLFENGWGNDMIERIDIRLLESIGVEDRGTFYDKVGALRDVGQNHLLAMLAAIVAPYPPGSAPEDVQNGRASVLEALEEWSDERIARDTCRAQYAGYDSIAGVAKGSQTETYFALRTGLSSPRWRGVPIFLEAGKRAAEPVKEIVVTLKHPRKCLLCEIGSHGPNTITFRLEPSDEIVIKFWSKKPGFERALEERAFTFFLYEKEAAEQYVEEYAKVLNAAIAGERALFVGASEIDAMWRFTDPVEDAWRRGAVELGRYEPGTRPRPRLLSDGGGAVKPPGSVGIIGLGKMGAGLGRQLLERSWRVVGYNHSPEATRLLEKDGAAAAFSLAEFAAKLEAPRTVWLMVPYAAVDSVLAELLPLLEKGDAVIDGGNSPYKESMRRGAEMRAKGIAFLDAGVSGGPGGARSGACVMVGGSPEDFLRHERLFADISLERGYAHVGPSGAGHFVKMVHNGIEYGMMQAIAEGFEVLKRAPFSLDLLSVAELYNRGSVVASRLVGWLAEALEKFGPDLDTDDCCSPSVGRSGEGEWTVEAARELGAASSVIEQALRFRIESSANPTFAGRVLSAMRHQFGGHDASR